ncbi:DUF3369 domain-containing protein [Thiocapsa sp. UBA6158]|jgi:response regulator RpfG family c-di-GMP phosphodiesterase|uniref:DUF3369 domain-containing protein n=1 Tax=Thiocapsa sp. UBA6158 TaxID=1947692 RepID=UPI0026000A4C|nr:DUF3369 domain-containing protein [Thiocapsa sp. UBA6158]
MNNDNDDLNLLFAEEDDPPAPKAHTSPPWKIMIVDDEPAMHEVTTLALNGIRFHDRDLSFIHCYSGADAREAILQHPDTVMMLLDVVMESDHAGLDVARYVREVARNQRVRIVLRTGQPGQAPERRVIVDYDINDYKEKTELTASKLFTLVYSCLRAYRDIETIERSKQGLVRVIESSADIFQLSALDRFAGCVLEQLAALLGADPGVLYLAGKSELNGLAAQLDTGVWQAIAGTGDYRAVQGKPIDNLLDDDHLALLKQAQETRRNVFADGVFVGYFEDRIGHHNLLLVDGVERMDALEQSLVNMFTRNVSIAFENVHLHKDIEETQSEIVYMLGEAVERRSRETGYHVKRVAEISRLLGLSIGMSAEEAEVLRLASPLHDLGKIAIPDAILNKPGRHTPEEQVIMRTHAEIGYQMLRNSKRRILQAAAIIAHEHHERWDGAGYPRGLAGDDIHIYGRITAVADIFDALGSPRCYKDAWPLEKIQALFTEERGRHFDPTLVDILFDKLDELIAIRERLPDQ